MFDDTVSFVLGQIDPVIITRAIFSIIFVLALYPGAEAIRRVIERHVEEPSTRFGMMRIVDYSATGLGLIMLGSSGSSGLAVFLLSLA